MRTRGLIVLATIAALLGAPSLASGAGNSLANPSSSPGAGTVETAFTFRVGYEGQFSATAITVSVAGLQLPLALVSGTSLLGTWSVSTALPPGTWTPTFTATALRGNTASVAGPPVYVAGLGPPPTPTATVSTSSPPRSGEEVDSGQPYDPGDSAPDPAPADNVEASAPPPGDGAPASPDPSSPAGPGGTGGGTDGPSTTTSSPAPDGAADEGEAPAAPDAPDPDSDPSAAARVVPAAEGGDQAEETHGGSRNGLLGLVLIVGLSGVAAVAIIGSALLVVGRRTSQEPEAAGSFDGTSDAADTETLLQRRIVRRAKVRLADDPIVAAMGVDDQVDARRRRGGARPPAGDAGERPRSGRP
jgi:hypothetical protein